MSRQRVLTRGLPFTRSTDVVRVKVEKQVTPFGGGESYRQTMTHIKSEVRQEVLGTFALDIDYDGLVRALFEKASRSRGGKAQLARGLIRLVKVSEKIMKAECLEHSPREGWTEVQS